MHKFLSVFQDENMKFRHLVVLVVLIRATITNGSKMVCYYNSQSYWRQGVGKITYDHLKPALEHCDYLIYSHIGMNANTYQAESLDPKLELSTGKNNFKLVTDYKIMHPNLKVLLSLGGYADKSSPEKYLNMMESRINRINFICSLISLVNEYNFDGIDLAWEFPIVKQNQTSTSRRPDEVVWKVVQNYATFFIADDKPQEHRKFFVQLCKELRAALNGENKTLTLSVNPETDYKVYYDLDALNQYVEQIHLMTYDYSRPEQTPEIGDYHAPLYPQPNRDPEKNVQATVNYFLNSSIPVDKLILAIPTFARTWKLTSRKSAVPPVPADGPGDAGLYTNVDGILAYYEICLGLTTLSNPSSLPSDYYTIAEEANIHYGMYAYRLRRSLFFGSDGTWISYETPDTAAVKGEFAKRNGLGGLAIVDLTMDDFRGHCATRKDTYPIVRAARRSYMGLKQNRL